MKINKHHTGWNKYVPKTWKYLKGIFHIEFVGYIHGLLWNKYSISESPENDMDGNGILNPYCFCSYRIWMHFRQNFHDKFSIFQYGFNLGNHSILNLANIYMVCIWINISYRIQPISIWFLFRKIIWNGLEKKSILFWSKMLMKILSKPISYK